MAVITVPECYHGGAFFSAIGDEFDRLDRAEHVISADVLDAWFAPSPRVMHAVAEHLSFLLRTSPPTGCEGLVRAIARSRGVAPANILVGGGSSDLIFLALTQWLDPSSRVLILDPMYGEYAHVLEQVVRCQVDRFSLDGDQDYDLDVVALARRVQAKNYDLIILVNPNSPTGRHCSAAQMRWLLQRIPRHSRVWVDETYVEYAGVDESLERDALRYDNVVICKSMSKVYALSGARVGYLCASEAVLHGLRGYNPPWAVNLIGQVAAVAALNDEPYYRERWQATHVLRESLADGLESLGLSVTPAVANFLLCHLPSDVLSADALVHEARARNLFIRDVGSMGATLCGRAVRIAVKDARSNAHMLAILRDILAH